VKEHVNPAPALERRRHVLALDAGHREIDERDLRVELFEDLEDFVPLRKQAHLVPALLEERGQRGNEVGVVIDDEDPEPQGAPPRHTPQDTHRAPTGVVVRLPSRGRHISSRRPIEPFEQTRHARAR